MAAKASPGLKPARYDTFALTKNDLSRFSSVGKNGHEQPGVWLTRKPIKFTLTTNDNITVCSESHRTKHTARDRWNNALTFVWRARNKTRARLVNRMTDATSTAPALAPPCPRGSGVGGGEWEGDGSGLLEDGDDGTGSRRDDPSMRVGIVSQIDDVKIFMSTSRPTGWPLLSLWDWRAQQSFSLPKRCDCNLSAHKRWILC